MRVFFRGLQSKKRAEDNIRFWFYFFLIRSISCKLILYRAPYKVVVDTWAMNSTYLFWGDIQGNYQLFIRLRAKKEKGNIYLEMSYYY